MQKNIHPKLNKVNVVCSTCNTEIEFQSIKPNIKIDICSNCHPFYNGTNTFARAAGRVEKFNQKYNTKKTPTPTPTEKSK